MNGNDNRTGNASDDRGPIANMSRLDFLLLLWEARIIGEEYVEANT